MHTEGETLMMVRFLIGTGFVFAFIACLVLADWLTRNLSQWLGSVLP